MRLRTLILLLIASISVFSGSIFILISLAKEFERNNQKRMHQEKLMESLIVDLEGKFESAKVPLFDLIEKDGFTTMDKLDQSLLAPPISSMQLPRNFSAAFLESISCSISETDQFSLTVIRPTDLCDSNFQFESKNPKFLTLNLRNHKLECNDPDNRQLIDRICEYSDSSINIIMNVFETSKECLRNKRRKFNSGLNNLEFSDEFLKRSSKSRGAKIQGHHKNHCLDLERQVEEMENRLVEFEKYPICPKKDFQLSLGYLYQQYIFPKIFHECMYITLGNYTECDKAHQNASDACLELCKTQLQNENSQYTTNFDFEPFRVPLDYQTILSIYDNTDNEIPLLFYMLSSLKKINIQDKILQYSQNIHNQSEKSLNVIEYECINFWKELIADFFSPMNRFAKALEKRIKKFASLKIYDERKFSKKFSKFLKNNQDFKDILALRQIHQLSLKYLSLETFDLGIKDHSGLLSYIFSYWHESKMSNFFDASSLIAYAVRSKAVIQKPLLKNAYFCRLYTIYMLKQHFIQAVITFDPDNKVTTKVQFKRYASEICKGIIECEENHDCVNFLPHRQEVLGIFELFRSLTYLCNGNRRILRISEIVCSEKRI